MTSTLSSVVERRLSELQRTQSWLAEQIGVTDQAVSKWMRSGSITVENAIKVARALGVSVDELVTAEQSPATNLYRALLALPADDRAAALDFLLYKINSASAIFTSDHEASYSRMIAGIVADMKSRPQK